MENFYKPKVIEQPQIISKKFKEKTKECIVVDIEGEEYDKCVEASGCNKFWGNSKPGVYGAGLGKTDDDPYKPARTGLLGQMAFAKLFDESVDLTYRKGGDKQDNLIGGHKYDMKFAMRDRGDGLIYHTNKCGKQIPLDKDVYVFGYIDNEDRENKKAKVVITGFALQKDVKECEVKPGYLGEGHLNYVVPTDTLRPITGLLKRVMESNIKGNK